MKFLEEDIQKLMQQFPNKIYKANHLAKDLKLGAEDRKNIKTALKSLAAQGKISELRNNHFTYEKKGEEIIGRISITEQGYGFVRPRNIDTKDADIFIRTRNTKDAIDGDLVEITLVKPPDEENKLYEGKVVRIVERGRKLVVGRFFKTQRGAYIEPRSDALKRRVSINKTFKKDEIKDGTWVVVEITKYTVSPEPLIAELKEILGEDGDKGLDVMVLIRDFGVVPEFPDAVINESENLEREIPQEEIDKRLDMRSKKVFTIDPVHAKDFDDALSIEKLDNGLRRVGVHIADVAYYVHKGSVIDTEALDRATSIYPVDRVVPMLPVRLSNDLCSLVPHKDRLTMTVLADLDDNANIMNVSFHNSIINSVHRLNYYEVQKIFDGDTSTKDKYSDIVNDVLLLKDITKKLFDKRIKRGALDLDVPETEIIMDERGVAIDIKPYERLESHKLVEECMLLANEVVAAHLLQCKVPAVYRIHEAADPKRLADLGPALKIFGLKLPPKEKLSPFALQKLLDQTQKMENGAIGRRMVLRSLKRAKYSHINKGHFGLASTAYLHFTSPIRRYPDLAVHRILKEWIENKKIGKDRKDELNTICSEVAYISSEREDRATLIERDTTELKCLEFMRRFIGEHFTGYICGIMSYGFYVTLKEYPAEGLVLLKNIDSDFFKIDDTGYLLKGKRTGRVLKLGQKINVQIVKIDLLKVEMELKWIEK